MALSLDDLLEYEHLFMNSSFLMDHVDMAQHWDEVQLALAAATDPDSGEIGYMSALAAANISNETLGYFGVHWVPNPLEMLSPWTHNPWFTMILVVYSITLVVGLLSNMAAIASLKKEKKKHRNAFLISSLSADMILLGVGEPLQVASYFVLEWDRIGIVCKAAVFIDFLTAVSVVMNLTAVSLERFLVIAFPLQSRNWCSNKNSVRGAVLIWIASAMLALPNIQAKDTVVMTYASNDTFLQIYQCLSNEDVNLLSVAFVRFLILFVFPSVVMATCYGSAIRHLWRSSKIARYLTNQSSRHRRQQYEEGAGEALGPVDRANEPSMASISAGPGIRRKSSIIPLRSLSVSHRLDSANTEVLRVGASQLVDHGCFGDDSSKGRSHSSKLAFVSLRLPLFLKTHERHRCLESSCQYQREQHGESAIVASPSQVAFPIKVVECDSSTAGCLQNVVNSFDSRIQGRLKDFVQNGNPDSKNDGNMNTNWLQGNGELVPTRFHENATDEQLEIEDILNVTTKRQVAGLSLGSPADAAAIAHTKTTAAEQTKAKGNPRSAVEDAGLEMNAYAATGAAAPLASEEIFSDNIVESATMTTTVFNHSSSDSSDSSYSQESIKCSNRVHHSKARRSVSGEPNCPSIGSAPCRDAVDELVSASAAIGCTTHGDSTSGLENRNHAAPKLGISASGHGATTPSATAGQKMKTSKSHVEHTGPRRARHIINTRRRLKTMLMAHIVLFMVCWGPRLLWDVAMYSTEDPSFSPLIYVTRIFLFLLPFVHAAINPLLYFCMSSALRTAFWELATMRRGSGNNAGPGGAAGGGGINGGGTFGRRSTIPINANVTGPNSSVVIHNKEHLPHLGSLVRLNSSVIHVDEQQVMGSDKPSSCGEMDGAKHNGHALLDLTLSDQRDDSIRIEEEDMNGRIRACNHLKTREWRRSVDGLDNDILIPRIREAIGGSSEKEGLWTSRRISVV